MNFEHHDQLLTWMNTNCEDLKRFPYNRVVEFDTQYDLDGVKKEFEAFYLTLVGTKPNGGLFYFYLQKICKEAEPDYFDASD